MAWLALMFGFCGGLFLIACGPIGWVILIVLCIISCKDL
jgi:hypothetical protein